MARLMLVIDDARIRSGIRSVLRGSHELIDMVDGAAALRMVAEKAVDLLLVHTAFADMDAFDLCRRVRAHTDRDSLPVVLVSSPEEQVENRLRALEVGASDFMVLPLDAADGAARLSAILRSRGLSDAGCRTGESAMSDAERTRQLEEVAAELRTERDALREAFSLLEGGLVLLDGAGRIQLENAALRPLLGETVNQTASCEHLADETSAPESIRESLASLAREAIQAQETRERALSAHGRQLEARAYPAAGGRALLCVRDMTQTRDREVRLLQSEKLASIGMLAAGVAHEINNPASFVLANIEALASLLRLLDNRLGGDPRAARKLGLADALFEAMTIVQESKEGMARIHRIVRDLHSFSRVDDDIRSPTDVNIAVESSLSMLRSELRYRATVERDLRASQRVSGSAARLGQVFLNLIVNAAHALAEGNPKRNRLVVRSYDQGPEVIVEVEDNGPGIPAEIRSRIFDSFFTTKPPGVGTGLGLPISRDIVRSAGGELTVESEAGRGALFRVRLPAATSVPTQKTKTPTLRAARARRRILAIDDEALLLKAYRRMLIGYHDVETTLGAREALRIFGEDREFDVVLCDLQMPDMSGSELYFSVKQRWPDLADRFIFITGGAFSSEARRFLEESMVACIPKPFHVRDLLELIEARSVAPESASAAVASQ
jgi:signal transduction histidine kinase